MRRMLANTSLTVRFVSIVMVGLMMLVAIDYIVLTSLPRKIARDSVEVALREQSQSLNGVFREDRDTLQRETERFVKRPDIVKDVLAGDRDAIEQKLSEAGLPGDVRFRFIRGSRVDGSGVGMVNAAFTLADGDRTRSIVFYRPVEGSLLDRATENMNEQVAFALERDGEFVAKSSNFPGELDASQVNASNDMSRAELLDLDVAGDELHVFSRATAPDTSYELHTLSTKQLEEEALAEVRRDVQTAIVGLTLASVLIAALLVIFVGKAVRGFAKRVRALADGDYGTTLAVRGNDSFADLASSVNRLSADLEQRVGQLEDTARAFRTTLETLEEGICTWSADGEITYWNRGAEQLTGIGRERAKVNDPVISFLYAERAPGLRRVTLPVRRSGRGLPVDLVVTTMPDGGILQTFRDTTILDSLQQTQRNFMATAAHELRTPITTILGFADTLTNPGLELTDHQRAEFLQIITTQAHQLQEIADAFFTNHQLANERVEVTLAPTNVEEVVQAALARSANASDERAREIDAIVIDIPSSLYVVADARALIGVVTALVDNAIKYGEQPITISAEQTGGSVALLVRDRGTGIDPYHQNRVFDPFYRIDVDMRSGVGGAGLGLFTARKLVEAMHGVVQVRSAPGDGATFIVELPIAAAESGDADAPGHRGLHLVG